MLKANVGLSRKISRDYQSTGYTLNIEGEIAATPDDHEGVLGRIKELYSWAEEALAVEIDRDQGEQAMGRRDDEPTPPVAGKPNGAKPNERPPADPNPPQRRGNGAAGGNGSGDDSVTNKQVQFVFTLAKRQRLSNAQLETQIEQVVGRRVRVYDLSKREAGRVIDALNQDNPGNSRTAPRA
jgi:hypothetical protein